MAGYRVYQDLGTRPPCDDCYRYFIRAYLSAFESLNCEWSFAVSCILRARGANFAVDDFLAGSSLTPVAIVRRGQPQFAQFPSLSPIPDESGFHAVASEADFSNLETQIADAVRFVEQNQGELARLVAFSGVQKVSLDFGIEERDMAAQRECFPPNLLRIVGDLGIWLEFTLYPCPNLSPD